MTIVRFLLAAISGILGAILGFYAIFFLTILIGAAFDRFVHKLEALFMLVGIGAVIFGAVGAVVIGIIVFYCTWQKLKKWMK